MIRAACLILSLVGCVASAAPVRAAVVASGDCRDPELVSATRALSKRLEKQSSVALITEQEVLEKLGRAPSRSIEEIQRLIDTAQQMFYQAHYHKAVSHLDNALAEIQRLPPGQTRWQLTVSARIIEGLTRSRLKRDGGSDEAFRRVLRIDPAHQLDPDYFGPSTIQHFERIRKELAAAKKYPMKITSIPTGSNLYVDGKLMGKTPTTLSMPAGAYQIVVGKEETFSLPRELEFQGSSELHVDLRFESSIDTSRVACISKPPNERTRLDSAVKLGSALDVERVVVLRFDRAQVGPSWLAASLVHITDAGKAREGGLQVGSQGVTEEGIAELARFVATGELTANVRPVSELKRVGSSPTPPAEPAEPVAVSSPKELAPQAPPEQLAAATPAGTTSVETSAPAPQGSNSFLGKVLLGVGGVSLLSGGIAQGFAIASSAEFEELNRNGLTEAEAPLARAALDRRAIQQPGAIVGFALGAVSAGVGAYLLLSGSDGGGETSVALLPSSSGSAVVVTGSF